MFARVVVVNAGSVNLSLIKPVVLQSVCLNIGLSIMR